MKEKAFSPGQEFRTLATITLMVMALLAGGALLAAYPVKFSLFAVGAVLAVILTARYPEVVFALFLTAGMYKADPRFQLPYIDITVFLGILTALGILWAVMQGRTRLTMPPLRMFLPFLAICGMSALSLMYTIAPVYGSEKLSRFITLTTLALLAPFYLGFQERKKYRNFLAASVAVALAMLFEIYQQGGLNPSAEEAVSAFGSDYLIWGAEMGAAFIMILFYFVLRERSIARRVAYIAVCPAILYALMISGARGPLIALVTTMVMVLVVYRQPQKRSSRVIIGIAVLLIGIGLYYSYASQDFARMTRRMMVLGEGGGDSALERLYMAKAALKVMSTPKYFLPGLGIGGFSVYYAGFDAARGIYPHNIFLELGTETGIAGLAAVIFFLAWGFKQAFMTMKNMAGEYNFIAVSAASLFLYSVINAMKSGDINDNRLLFAMVGVLYSLDRSAEKSDAEGKAS